jgi:hypothetical protein
LRERLESDRLLERSFVGAAVNGWVRLLAGLTEQAEGLSHTGRIADGLALLEAEIAQREAGWLTPAWQLQG